MRPGARSLGQGDVQIVTSRVLKELRLHVLVSAGGGRDRAPGARPSGSVAYTAPMHFAVRYGARRYPASLRTNSSPSSADDVRRPLFSLSGFESPTSLAPRASLTGSRPRPSEVGGLHSRDPPVCQRGEVKWRQQVPGRQWHFLDGGRVASASERARRRGSGAEDPHEGAGGALVAKARAEAFEGRLRPSKASKLLVGGRMEGLPAISKRDNDTWKSEEGRAKHLTRHPGRSSLPADGEGRRRVRTKGSKTTRRKKAPSPASLDREWRLLKRILNYGESRAARCRPTPSRR